LNAAVRRALASQPREPANQQRQNVVSMTLNSYGEKIIDVSKMNKTVRVGDECISMSIQVNLNNSLT